MSNQGFNLPGPLVRIMCVVTLVFCNTAEAVVTVRLVILFSKTTYGTIRYRFYSPRTEQGNGECYYHHTINPY